MKKRILFVDDEPKILRGLQRMLCDLEDEWDMEFVESGTEALNLLDEKPFDVIVTDMRMPIMDGADLLNEVMKRHPEVVRLVLSGHSNQELILKSLGTAHQYMAKPCDPEKLTRMVNRACALRSFLADESLRLVISRLNTVPSLPQLYIELTEELRNPEGTIKKVGEIISKDAGMTAKLMHIVNSAFFGLPRHVTDPGHAASLLGMETLKAIILTSHVFTKFESPITKSRHFERLWSHCLATGTFASFIAIQEKANSQLCDHTLVAGLLHDTGKLVLASSFEEEYNEALNIEKKEAISIFRAEEIVFGTTHAEVGAYLFGLWGLPDPVVEAVAFHHRPDRCVVDQFTPLTAVHVADVLEHNWSAECQKDQHLSVDTEYLDRLGLADRLSGWQEACAQRLMARVES